MVNIVQGRNKKKEQQKQKTESQDDLGPKKARYSSHTLNEESIHNQQEGEP